MTTTNATRTTAVMAIALVLGAYELLPWLFLLLITILLFKQLLPFKKRSTTLHSVRRLRGLPLIGNLHQLGEHPHASLAALAAKHAAPLMLLRLGTVPALVVSSADAAREVFQHHDGAVSGRPALYAATRLSYDLRSISFAQPHDAFWKTARRACVSELLGAPRVRALRAARERAAAALVAAVTEISTSGAVVNLSEMLLATSSKIIRRVAFGDDGEESEDIWAILDETQRLLGGFWVADYMPWLGWLDALRGLRRRLEKNFHELDAFYERVIDDHLNRRMVSKGSSEGYEDDLVDVLLRLHGDPDYRSTFGDRSHIKGVLTDMFIAGSDTSSATLEWTMTELVRHPAVLAKAQDEVRRAVGDKDMVYEFDLPRLHYLKLVMKESLRLHPPAPLLVQRETTETCTIGGHEIRAKTRVIINAKAIGVDPGAWPDAARFAPERHEGDSDIGDFKPSHDRFALVPFGAGRRSCPGVHFATAVVELVLANLLLCFDWGLPAGEVDLEESVGITVHKKNPLLLVAKRRGVP